VTYPVRVIDDRIEIGPDAVATARRRQGDDGDDMTAPSVSLIEGDGIGPEITAATVRAVEPRAAGAWSGSTPAPAR